ncbi:MAG: hypothetical protein JWM80_4395 [Cyanobacteria bacterium RYN_339]|nr:hypothetical protein [Cyanobacteria bacterium RYN_339]
MKWTLAAVGVACWATPALAADAPAAPHYPNARVGGYLETVYEVESFVPSPLHNAFDRTPFHVGQVKVLVDYAMSEQVDGLLELFPIPKSNPGEYAEYRDVVGNNAPTPFTNTGRLQVSLHGLPTDATFTVGQVRVPFGNWDDWSVHRDLFRAKSNPALFGGSPLRRLDMGAILEGEFLPAGPWTYRLAAMGRAATPAVNDFARLSDYVGRLAWRGEPGEIGVNAYVPDLKDATFLSKGALGVDFSLNLPLNLSLVGEYVDQDDLATGVFVRGFYGRLNYDWSDLLPGVRTAVGYETCASNVSTDVGNNLVLGARYRLLNGMTLGGDLLVGTPDYPGGHLHLRLETRF